MRAPHLSSGSIMTGRKEWWDDPNLTVTGLSENSSDCEVNISLSQDIGKDVDDPYPGVAGVYRAEGLYFRGRPVLQHSGGLFTLSVRRWGRGWEVGSDVGGDWFLRSGSAPSHCPAATRAARSERSGHTQTHWSYWSKQTGTFESSGIIVQCNMCTLTDFSK